MITINPINLLGTFMPEEQDCAWGQYVGKNCVIVKATFTEKNQGELVVRFLTDGLEITIQQEEFVVF